MAGRECIITKKDLKILGKLSERAEGYRLTELATQFDLDAQSVYPNLKKMEGYGLVDSYAEKVVRGAGMFYRITNEGGDLYQILQGTLKGERRRKEVDIGAIRYIFAHLGERIQISQIAQRIGAEPLEVRASLLRMKKNNRLLRKDLFYDETDDSVMLPNTEFYRMLKPAEYEKLTRVEKNIAL